MIPPAHRHHHHHRHYYLRRLQSNIYNNSAAASSGIPCSTLAPVLFETSSTFDSSGVTIFWVINFTIAVLLIVTCCYWVIRHKPVIRPSDPSNAYQRRLMERDEHNAKTKETPEKRLEKLQQSWERRKVTKVLSAEDFVMTDEECSERDSETDTKREEDGEDCPALVIDTTNVTPTKDDKKPIPEAESVEYTSIDLVEDPISEDSEEDSNALDIESSPAAVSNIDDMEVSTSALDIMIDDDLLSTCRNNGLVRLTPSRSVPNCCAVCLCSYDVGETVVWSSNPKCIHAFHYQCILDWFIKKILTEGGTTPCPCCRQEFTELIEQSCERKITWEAGRAFDLQRVHWR